LHKIFYTGSNQLYPVSRIKPYNQLLKLSIGYHPY